MCCEIERVEDFYDYSYKMKFIYNRVLKMLKEIIENDRNNNKENELKIYGITFSENRITIELRRKMEVESCYLGISSKGLKNIEDENSCFGTSTISCEQYWIFLNCKWWNSTDDTLFSHYQLDFNDNNGEIVIEDDKESLNNWCEKIKKVLEK